MTLVVNRANQGKRKGSKCVKPTRELRHARSCTYYTKVKSLSQSDVAGANKLTFSTKGLHRGSVPARRNAAQRGRQGRQAGHDHASA